MSSVVIDQRLLVAVHDALKPFSDAVASAETDEPETKTLFSSSARHEITLYNLFVAKKIFEEIKTLKSQTLSVYSICEFYDYGKTLPVLLLLCNTQNYYIGKGEMHNSSNIIESYDSIIDPLRFESCRNLMTYKGIYKIKDFCDRGFCDKGIEFVNC